MPHKFGNNVLFTLQLAIRSSFTCAFYAPLFCFDIKGLFDPNFTAIDFSGIIVCTSMKNIHMRYWQHFIFVIADDDVSDNTPQMIVVFVSH